MEGRVAVVVVALVVVFGPLVAVFGPVVGAATSDHGPTGNETDAGERTAGVIGVERAVVSGAVERARFERDLGAADTGAARAETVAAYLNRGRDRIAALERYEHRLDEARENGSMSAAEHDARTERLGVRAENVRRLGTALRDAAATLPADLRREYDIETTTIRRLETRADELAERTRGDTARIDTGTFGDVARMIDAYNAHVEANGSGFLDDQLRGERVDLHVESTDETRVVSFRIDDDGRFVDARAGSHGDATLRAETDRRTVRRISTADDAATSFRRAVRSGEISIDGIGVVNGLKWRLVDLVSSVRG